MGAELNRQARPISRHSLHLAAIDRQWATVGCHASAVPSFPWLAGPSKAIEPAWIELGYFVGGSANAGTTPSGKLTSSPRGWLLGFGSISRQHPVQQAGADAIGP